MTPMIDVVFLLLVFFICASIGGTADSLLPAELKGNSEPAVDVPAPRDEPIWEHPVIQIRMENDADSVRCYLNDQVVEMDTLTRRLRQLANADAESRIILDIDDSVEVQQFISLYDLCQRLDFSNIAFRVAASGTAVSDGAGP